MASSNTATASRADLQRIAQLAIRLESETTTAERLEALEQLQALSRAHPVAVCQNSLSKAFEICQDGRSAEETQEALELINKLVTCRDREAALANTSTLLSERNNVELLLYLLEHEDLTVGVQTSQILTELHANDGTRLEALIQDCPEGMTKLLQRLPDSSREAVRNQALLLVQQLTSANEEMKKTLVFNEGFEVLFGIVQSEYNATQDTNMVVQDCLHICCNILTRSETCQRLFFGMGSEWALRLAYFFDPVLLENPPADDDPSFYSSATESRLQEIDANLPSGALGMDFIPANVGSNLGLKLHKAWVSSDRTLSIPVDTIITAIDGVPIRATNHKAALEMLRSSIKRHISYEAMVQVPQGRQPFLWYNKPGSVTCAALALAALANALTPPAPAHQQLLGVSLAGLIPASAFSIARQGPLEMVDGALALLARLVDGNGEVAAQVSAAVVRLDAAVKGINIPASARTPMLRFGWRPLPGDERTCITVPALLAERYMYDCELWAAEGQSAPTSPSSPRSVNAASGSGGMASPARFYAMHSRGAFALGCLQVLEKIFFAHPEGCELCIQHVLAPPLPLPDDEDDNPDVVRDAELESCRPLGSLLLGVLMGGLEGAYTVGNAGVGAAAAAAADSAEGARFSPRAAARGADVLALLFAQGGSIARELSTAVTTGHTRIDGMMVSESSNPNAPLLPFLLAAAGRAYRLPIHGPLLYSATLRMLACVATGCGPAARQLLQDPSALFVLDMASTAGERTGVPILAQCLTCFFLGACALALTDEGPSSSSPSENEEVTTRRALLALVDRHITLPKFSALLSKPLDDQQEGGADREEKPPTSSLQREMFFCQSFRNFYEAQVTVMLRAVAEYGTLSSAAILETSIVAELEVEAVEKALEASDVAPFVSPEFPYSDTSAQPAGLFDGPPPTTEDRSLFSASQEQPQVSQSASVNFFIPDQSEPQSTLTIDSQLASSSSDFEPPFSSARPQSLFSVESSHTARYPDSPTEYSADGSVTAASSAGSSSEVSPLAPLGGISEDRTEGSSSSASDEGIRIHSQSEALAVLHQSEEYQDALESEKRQLLANYAVLQEQMAEKQRELDDVLSQFQVWQEAVQQRDDRIIQLGEVEASYYSKCQECTDLQSAAEAERLRLEQLNAVIDDLKLQLAEALEAQRDDSEDLDRTATTDQSSALDISRDHHSDLARQLDEASEDARAARADAVASDRLRVQLEGDVIRLTEQCSALRAQLDREERGAIDGTKSPPPTSEQVLQQISALETSLREAQQQLSTTEQQLRESNVLLSDLQADLEESREQAEEAAREASELRDERNKLIQQESATALQAEHLREAVDEGRTRLEEAEARGKVLEGRLAGLNEELVETRKLLQLKQRELEAVAPVAESIFGSAPISDPIPAVAQTPAMTAAKAKSLFDTPPGQTSKRPDNEAASFFSTTATAPVPSAATATGGFFDAQPPSDGLFGAPPTAASGGGLFDAPPGETQVQPHQQGLFGGAPPGPFDRPAISVSATNNPVPPETAALQTQLLESEQARTAAQEAILALRQEHSAALAQAGAAADLKARELEVAAAATEAAQATQGAQEALLRETAAREEALQQQLAAVQAQLEQAEAARLTTEIHDGQVQTVVQPEYLEDDEKEALRRQLAALQAKLDERERELALNNLRELRDRDAPVTPRSARHPSNVADAELTTPYHEHNHTHSDNSAYPNSAQTLDGRSLSMHTPAGATGGRMKAALGLLGVASPQQLEAGRLNAEIARERRRLQQLQEQHNDLLSLLAQQDLELSVFRSTLEGKLGPRAVTEAESQAERRCIERYGSYVNTREDVTDDDNSQD